MVQVLPRLTDLKVKGNVIRNLSPDFTFITLNIPYQSVSEFHLFQRINRKNFIKMIKI
jgi:hypothetical protein